MKITLLLILFFILLYLDAEEIKLSVQRYEIPKFKDNQNNRITGLASDGQVIYVATENSWGEFKYKDSKLLFEESFMAPTNHFIITAVSCNKEAFVYNAENKSVIKGHRGELLLKRELGVVTGMAEFNKKIFLSSGYKLYQINLSSGEVERELSLNHQSCGLAAYGKKLYSCSANKIYEFNQRINLTQVYKIDVSIASLGCINNSTFAAADFIDNIIYIIKH